MPHFCSNIIHLESTAKFVILVEKDTVFEKLLKDGLLTKMNDKCILITVRLRNNCIYSNNTLMYA